MRSLIIQIKIMKVIAGSVAIAMLFGTCEGTRWNGDKMKSLLKDLDAVTPEVNVL